MEGSWTAAARRWMNGDEAAQFDLEERMRPFLIEMLGLVRRRRPNGLQGRIETEGVVQAAFKSFLTGAPKGEFPDLPDREAVKRVLTHLVNRALADEIHRNMRAKRAPDREIGPAPLATTHARDGEPSLDLADWLQNFSQSLHGIHEKAMDILELLLQGYTTAECARELDLGLRTTQQIRQRMRELWNDDEAGDKSVDAG